jgi:hypothetical protein
MIGARIDLNMRRDHDSKEEEIAIRVAYSQ